MPTNRKMLRDQHGTPSDGYLAFICRVLLIESRRGYAQDLRLFLASRYQDGRFRTLEAWSFDGDYYHVDDSVVTETY